MKVIKSLSGRAHEVYLVMFENSPAVLKIGSIEFTRNSLVGELFFSLSDKSGLSPRIFETNIKIDEKGMYFMDVPYLVREFVEGENPKDLELLGGILARIHRANRTREMFTPNYYLNSRFLPFIYFEDVCDYYFWELKNALKNYEKLGIMPNKEVLEKIREKIKCGRLEDSKLSLVHSDFYPANVFLGKNGVKVIDASYSGYLPVERDFVKIFRHVNEPQRIVNSYIEKFDPGENFDFRVKLITAIMNFSSYPFFLKFWSKEVAVKLINQALKLLKSI